MKEVFDWTKAVAIVLGVVALLYATWLIAIFTTILAAIFVIKLVVSEDP